MATEAQIAANRHNAQKCTGPQTPEGKAISSRNALKYATLARQILPAGTPREDSSAEFRDLCDEYYADLSPVGPVEEMLVDQIVKGVWCMRRAHHAESAEINLNLKTVAKDTPKDTGDSGHVESVFKLAVANPGMDIIDLLAAKNVGCEFLLHILRQARQMFQRDKEITMEMYQTLFKPFGDSARSLTDPLTRMMDELNANAESPDPGGTLEKHRRDVMGFFDAKILHYEQLLAGRQNQIDDDARDRRNAALLPAPQTLNKILRYETIQGRQIFRALDQLQKLQARRSAKTTSATAL